MDQYLKTYFIESNEDTVMLWKAVGMGKNKNQLPQYNQLVYMNGKLLTRQ